MPTNTTRLYNFVMRFFVSDATALLLLFPSFA
jgi:hypothetical protein